MLEACLLDTDRKLHSSLALCEVLDSKPCLLKWLWPCLLLRRTGHAFSGHNQSKEYKHGSVPQMTSCIAINCLNAQGN